MPAKLVAPHLHNNLRTAGAWQSYGKHRAKVTAEVLERAEPGPGKSLLILGIGNGNDVDLSALALRFDSIHLADVDAAAVERTVARLPPEVQSKIRTYAPIDLSGALSRLDAWGPRNLSVDKIVSLPEAAADSVVQALPGNHDVVLSAGLLSQIAFSARLALGAEHQALRPVVNALAAAHLRAMGLLCRPGGQGLLITDVVSSETFPLIELFPTRDPMKLLSELSATGNTFTGTDPTLLLGLLIEHAAVAPLVADPDLLPSWLWTLSDEVTLLAFGISFRTKLS